MDYESLKIAVDAAQTAVTLGIAWYVHAAAKAQAKERDLADFRLDVDGRLDRQGQRLQHLEALAHPAPAHRVDDCLDEVNDRLARVEQDARHAPSHEDLKRMHVRLDTLSEELREIKGEFHGARRTLDLIHQHLLSERRRTDE